MSEYYTKSGSPSTGASGSSATMRAEFDLVSAGFDKLPTLSGNGSLPVFVNSGATALEATSASTARTRLGLGSIATQNANNVAVTGGTVTGLSQLASNNVALTGGSISGMTTVGTNNAAITGGTATGLSALSSNNVAITGGTASGLTTLGSNNVALTGGTISGVSQLGSNNVAITGGTISATASNNLTVTNSAINSTTVGATTPASGSFTTLVASGTITAQGLVDASGASAGQIKFPAAQNSSADVNTLDDYEEGTWTPGVSFGGGTTGLTYGTQSGTYTKIGRLVIATFNIVLSAKGSSTGTVNITGLPIAALTGPADVCTIDFGSMTTAECMMIGLINGSTTMVVKGTPAAANSTVNVTATDVSNTTSLSGTITYRSAT